MTEVGHVLRQRREDLGLSLDDIQSKTKIRKRYIQAIEEGDWSILPGEVYARGFIRSYAEALELDGFALLRQLDEQKQANPGSGKGPSVPEGTGSNKPAQQTDTSASPTGSQPKEEAVPPKAPPKTPERQPSYASKSKSSGVSSGVKLSRNRKSKGGGSHVGQAVTVIVILGVLGGGWWALQHHTQGGSQNATGSVLNELNNTVGNQVGSAPTVNNTTKVTPAPAPTVQVATKPFTNGTQTYLVKTKEPLKVTMAVTSPCWIQVVKQDSKSGPPAGQTIQTNQSQTWSAKNQVTIRIGHYPGVTFTVNGKTVNLPKVNHPYDVTFIKS